MVNSHEFLVQLFHVIFDKQIGYSTHSLLTDLLCYLINWHEASISSFWIFYTGASFSLGIMIRTSTSHSISNVALGRRITVTFTTSVLHLIVLLNSNTTCLDFILHWTCKAAGGCSSQGCLTYSRSITFCLIKWLFFSDWWNSEVLKILMIFFLVN